MATKTPVKKTAPKAAAAGGEPKAAKKVSAPKAKSRAQKSGIHILYAVSECRPFAATGGLAEVAGSLPGAMAALPGFFVTVAMPLYSEIADAERAQMRLLTEFTAELGWRKQYCGIYTLERGGVRYLFIGNDYYFKRAGLYGHYDDGERFAFFSKAVIDAVLKLDLRPDIIHCNDWQTALIPVYMRTNYADEQRLSNVKTLLTVHNIEYQGKYALSILEDVFGISDRYAPALEYNGLVNLLKGAAELSDGVSTVSPTYARELESPYFSHGLHHVFVRNRAKVTGILNGIDTEDYNPETDPALFKNFSAADLAGKAENKRMLRQMLNLPDTSDAPLIAMITRLVPHKGVDLVREALDEIMQLGVQFVLLGKGDTVYENYFSDMQNVYSSRLRSVIAFNADTSRKIYAGADIFLMPSKSEPCGLSQMIASRYGAVPVVRETGGLHDSIRDIGGEDGNGFTFSGYSRHELMHRIRAAADMWKNDAHGWQQLVKKVMTTDFSWSNSAQSYAQLYKNLLG